MTDIDTILAEIDRLCVEAPMGTLASHAVALAAEVRRLQTLVEYEHQRFLEESALRFAAEHVINYVTTDAGKVQVRLYEERKARVAP